jgi:hypothetical protein
MLYVFNAACARSKSKTWTAAVALAGLLLLSSQVGAQIASASLEGEVIDPSDAPLPGVNVSAQELHTNFISKATSASNGFYSLPNLVPGHYLLTASHHSFAKLQIAVALAPGEQRHIRLQMQHGTGIVKKAVEGESASGVEDASTIRDLPSNGRDWTQAATLQAGVSAVKTQPDAGNTNSGRGQRGFGAQMSVSGNRPQQNNYLLNGISINDYANSAPGSVLGLDLGADAVEQFAVVTSNYPADFGRSSGGVINAITRTGSNKFHGSVYEYLRNSALDARNFFDSIKPPFRRNQFGAAVGGPIRKDKTFFFVNYEGLRQSLGMTHVDTVPSTAARSGILSTGNVPVDMQAARYLAFFPLPNRGLIGPGDTGIFAFSGQVVTTENYVDTRLDYRWNGKDSVSGFYVFDGAQTMQPDALNVRIDEIETRRNVASFQERHAFDSQTLNFIRLGVNRVIALIGETPKAISPLAADTSFGFLPGYTSGSLNVVGLTNFTGGLGAASPFRFHWTSIQAYDDMSRTSGNHSLRFGVSVERMRDNMLAASDPEGVFAFHSLSDFLTNRPFSLSLALPGTVTPRDLRTTFVGAYVQDDFRVSKSFTVNAGLRYETSTVPTEVSGRLATLRHLTDAVPHLGDQYFENPTRLNFEPRLGIAWAVLPNRVTLRSGFAIFDVLPLPYEFELLSLFAAPYFRDATPSDLPPGSFPFGAVRIANSASTFRNVYIEPHPRRNYVNEWNLSAEVQTTKSSSLSLGYLGSRGIHQPFRADDTNPVLPRLGPGGYQWPNPVGSGTRLNANVGRLDGLFWRGDSYYDALQVQERANISMVQFQASYTWGKSFDTGSATIAGDQFANSVSSLPWYDLRLARGPSDFNIAQSLSLHLTVTIPAPRQQNWLRSGWRANGTFQASTGAPFTPRIGGDPLGTKSTDPYDVPNLVPTRGCRNPTNPGNPSSYLKLQCFQFPIVPTVLGNVRRNSVAGPGLAEVDFSVFKDTPIKRISEQFQLELRAEAFNLFNRTNFQPPLDHRTLFDQNGNIIPGAGLIDATATTSRQIQLGLKFIW